MLGIIGVGAMGGAIARGVLESGEVQAEELVVAALPVTMATDFASDTGARAAASNAELVREAGQDAIVIVAVKPHHIGGVLDEIAEDARENGTVIVSVAAGTPIASLQEHLAPGQPIVRVMPNVAAAVGASMTALAANDAATGRLPDVRRIFEAIGAVEVLAEKDFSAFTALAGSSPAFTFEYIDALARAGVNNGLTKAGAVRIAAQAVAGAAQLLLARLDDGATPASLADAVQSPGGTTVAGVVELEQAGFGAAIVRGAQATIDRDRELQG
ncbi:MAG: pyrroline-5-carboxylate reductase [Actinomycetaceae bacterium]|nr:pyrroline-5-carboxylate reductase [Actinomycetaceae bacterium]